MNFSWNRDLSVWLNILGIAVHIIAFLALTFGLMCLNSWLIMLLWNAVLTAVFGLITITFWQTFGIILIIWLLSGGIAKLIKIKINTKITVKNT